VHGHPELPKSAKAVFKTLRKVPSVTNDLLHIGFTTGFRECMKAALIGDDRVMRLQLGMDELSLFHSGNACVWPVLRCVTISKKSSPFTVSIYQLNSKPSDFEKFLRPTITELNLFMTSGIEFNGTLYRDVC